MRIAGCRFIVVVATIVLTVVNVDLAGGFKRKMSTETVHSSTVENAGQNRIGDDDDYSAYDDDDDDEDEDELYDDDDELQSDVYPSSPSSFGHREGTSQTQLSKSDLFWKTYRSSKTSRVIGGGNEDPRSQEMVKRHAAKIGGEGKCRIPQPRVVQVADVHPTTGKSYYPSCTIVHQCSESTGCCPPTHKCGPKRTEPIELHFYGVFEVPSYDGRHKRKTLKAEKLTFYNHTECECQLRSDEMPRDVYPTSDSPLGGGPACRCPSPFTLRPSNSGLCSCDCFDKQRDCIKYKKGKDYLNHEDRLCIEMRKCVPPSCDYGPYVRRAGRCLRRDEKYRF